MSTTTTATNDAGGSQSLENLVKAEYQSIAKQLSQQCDWNWITKVQPVITSSALVDYQVFLLCKYVAKDMELEEHNGRLLLTPTEDIDRVWKEHLLRPQHYYQMNKILSDALHEAEGEIENASNASRLIILQYYPEFEQDSQTAKEKRINRYLMFRRMVCNTTTLPSSASKATNHSDTAIASSSSSAVLQTPSKSTNKPLVHLLPNLLKDSGKKINTTTHEDGHDDNSPASKRMKLNNETTNPTANNNTNINTTSITNTSSSSSSSSSSNNNNNNNSNTLKVENPLNNLINTFNNNVNNGLVAETTLKNILTAKMSAAEAKVEAMIRAKLSTLVTNTNVSKEDVYKQIPLAYRRKDESVVRDYFRYHKLPWAIQWSHDAQQLYYFSLTEPSITQFDPPTGPPPYPLSQIRSTFIPKENDNQTMVITIRRGTFMEMTKRVLKTAPFREVMDEYMARYPNAATVGSVLKLSPSGRDNLMISGTETLASIGIGGVHAYFQAHYVKG